MPKGQRSNRPAHPQCCVCMALPVIKSSSPVNNCFSTVQLRLLQYSHSTQLHIARHTVPDALSGSTTSNSGSFSRRLHFLNVQASCLLQQRHQLPSALCPLQMRESGNSVSRSVS